MKTTKNLSRYRKSYLAIAIGCSLSAASVAGFEMSDKESEQEVTQRYIVTLAQNAVDQAVNERRTLSARQVKQQLYKATADIVQRDVVVTMDSTNSIVLNLTNKEEVLLSKQENIVSIEIDPVRHLMAESTPYGITMVQANQVSDVNSSNRKVCIMDTGYTLNHVDLPSSGVTGDDKAGSNSTGTWYNDGNGHGTHVAGTIAAIGGNGQGVVGVNPSGTLGLHIVKVFKDDGNWGYGSDLVIALEQCIAAGANVISMSLGGGGSSFAERSAFDSANAQGVLSVAAAGNSGDGSFSYPASYSSVMSVAAVDSSGNKANFSQFNNQVEIAAPGVGVNSTWNNGGYNSISGTSMATPHVSGVAALIWGHHPTCSNQQVRDAMNQSAEDRGAAGRDSSYGYGIVKAKAALDRLTSICGDVNNSAPDAAFSSSVSGNTATFTDQSTDDKGIASYSWDFGDESTSTQENPVHSYASEGTYQVTLTVSDAEGLNDSVTNSVTIGSEPPPGCDGLSEWSVTTSYATGDQVSYKGYKYTAIWWSTGAAPNVFSNVWRNDGKCSSTGENQPPVASFEASVNGLSVSFTNSSTDDKGVVSYSWSFGDGASSTSQNPFHTYSSAGTYTVTLTVSDAEGLNDSTSRTVTVDTTSGCEGLPPWNASTLYQVDEHVSYNGNKYLAIWWSRGAQPDIYSNVWSYQGSCR